MPHYSWFLSRSVRRLVVILLGLSSFSILHAQSATAPTAAEDPAVIDQIWQKASSKYDAEREALLKQVDAADHEGPYRPDWESLQKYEAPDWYRDAKVRHFHSLGRLFGSRLRQ